MLKILAFEVNGCTFALPSSLIREVIPYRKAAPVAQQTESMLGVLDVRHDTIPAVDLKALLWKDGPSGTTAQSCFVLVELEPDAPVVALLVDRIQSTIEAEEEELQEPPCVGGMERVDYIEKIRVEDQGAVVILKGGALLGRINCENGETAVECIHHE